MKGVSNKKHSREHVKKVGPTNKRTKVSKSRTRGPSRKTRGLSSSGFVKSQENPIIGPRQENSWESWQTFNPGAILLGDRVHFLYRAIGEDGLSRLGYASSSDGLTINERLLFPVYEDELGDRIFNTFSYFSGGSFGGAEDPRIVRVDDEGKLYITYTTCYDGLRVALTSIKIDDFLNKKQGWKKPVLISPPGEVHKNWVIFPEKIKGKYAILHSLSPKISIDYFDSLDFDDDTYVKSYYDSKIKKNRWDGFLRGAGPVPIKTKYGWLVFYHAMSANDFSKYKVGAMLLSLKDPTKIVARCPEPILEPDQSYENNGFKAGVVYASGAVVKGGDIFIYYGAADSYICVASANLKEFLDNLMKGARPQLKRKVIKK